MRERENQITRFLTTTIDASTAHFTAFSLFLFLVIFFNQQQQKTTTLKGFFLVLLFLFPSSFLSYSLSHTFSSALHPPPPISHYLSLLFLYSLFSLTLRNRKESSLGALCTTADNKSCWDRRMVTSHCQKKKTVRRREWRERKTRLGFRMQNFYTRRKPRNEREREREG